MATENEGDNRPKPEYGEYAPEGWEWKPEGAEESGASDDTAAAAGTSTPTTTPPSNAGSANMPGVPHNLGVGAALPPRSSASKQQHGPSQANAGAPYRAEAPQQGLTQAPSQAPLHNQAAPSSLAPSTAPAPAATKPARGADKVVTILLLVVGLIGALQSGLAMISLSSTFRIIGTAPGFESFTVPSWIDPAGKIIGIALLAFYGIVLVYSICRLRAGKLTFWVPLAAGAIVTVLVIAVVFIAIMTTPDLLNVLGNPEKSTELIENLQGRTGL
ncbi:DUF6264 family protein [Leucobacter denitrificans]|uniref:Uncharacterized protein n=1 Tax=Leucobacter denitrificans TaxID=683042 RepID=A0A7G9S6X1_9MICO|nr:DUF6264 family protein [Leucobacter denitrificans]QNN63596.1 hypothetical protein H9L06_04615 [Leucobacter denitrificans]